MRVCVNDTLTYPPPPSASENVLKRMTIVGVILSFRTMAQDALEDVRITSSHLLKVTETLTPQGGG